MRSSAPRFLPQVRSEVILGVFLAITAVLRDPAFVEIDMVADDSRPLRAIRNSGKVLARLVSSQSPDDCVASEYSHVGYVGDQRHTLTPCRHFFCQIDPLAARQTPQIAGHTRAEESPPDTKTLLPWGGVPCLQCFDFLLIVFPP